ncbi:MAG: [FeFe] hydrogenase, group A [Lachnospiraceae bacterium]|jgi:NADH-quinone oxidoreductase subunit G|nr:[FeFe] hydrogenase, group A [Lachnospiraceae bacterium]MDD3616142.1 [FeFe] hydrogenase, group A [Lachnospiraceae bacterium]
MGTMTIDGKRVTFTDEKNVLSVIRNAGIDLPTLCYHSELSTFGACRLCNVEDDRGKTFASCSEEPRDGMVIYTNTLRLMKYRRTIVELLLAAHCTDCSTCDKCGDCSLQRLARRLGLRKVRFENTKERQPLDYSSPSIVRDPNKCILCGDCVRMCAEVQGIGAIDFAFRGTEAVVTPSFMRKLSQTDCVNCGQCRVVCPTAAITIRDNTEEVWEAIADKNTRVVAQVAPAVRVAIGDAFGLPKGANAMDATVAILHRLGFDEVYDTAFSADLTVMEESKEFLERLESGENLPLLTSCCPAWVKLVSERYPEFKDNISTCRSPQGMFSAVLKEYYRDEANAQGKKTVVVSVMPCTAKKMEAKRPNSFTKGEQDTDVVITTTELSKMIKESGLAFDKIEPESADMPFGIASGAGVIFGVTGGVTEAVIRRLMPDHKKDTLKMVSELGARGEDEIKEFSVDYKGRTLNICVASGLATAQKVMDKVKSGEAHYDLIEIMACYRGCVMGGGQPVNAGPRTKQARQEGLYNADNTTIIKKSDENPMIQDVYDGILKGKEHELLHNECFV